MDPNATIALIASTSSLAAYDMREHIDNLRTWISRGGFHPDWSAYPVGEARYQRGVGADRSVFLSDARGIYIPRDFARTVDHARVAGVTPEQWADLENEDSESYWDTWSDVVDNAICTDDLGVRYRLEQDGDLFIVPTGMEWDDDNEEYVWPSDEQEAA